MTGPPKRRYRLRYPARDPFTEICGNCRFFLVNIKSLQLDVGECRRDQHFENRYASDWCGEFRILPSKETVAALEPDTECVDLFNLKQTRRYS